jgi:hypothetical protein
MLLEPQLIAELLLLGLATGFLAGLLGIGGGMLMVPAVTWVLGAKGFPARTHRGRWRWRTSLATICFTSISSVARPPQARRRAVAGSRSRWRGHPVGAALGAQIAVALPTKVLSVAVRAVRHLLGGRRCSWTASPNPAAPCPACRHGGGRRRHRACCRRWWARRRLRLRPLHAVVQRQDPQRGGDLAALGFPIALAGTLGYVWAGRDLPQRPPGSLGYLYCPAWS